MSMFHKGESVGFDLKPNQDKVKAEELSEARKLFFMFALFFLLIIPFISSYKAGLLEKYKVEVERPGVVARAEGKWEAADVGTFEEPKMVYPKALEEGWYKFEKAFKKVTLEMPEEADDHGDAHKDAAHKDGEHKEDESKKDEPKKAESKAHSDHGGHDDHHAHRGPKENIKWVHGYVHESQVKVHEAGWKGVLGSNATVLYTCWGIGGVSLLIAILAPAAGLPFLRLWMKVLVAPLAYVNTRIFLGLVFYGALTPLGFFFKANGTDILGMKLDPDAETYWNDRKELDKEHFEHIF